MPENFDVLLAELYMDFEDVRESYKADEARIMILIRKGREHERDYRRQKKLVTKQIETIHEQISQLRISIESLRNKNGST